MFAVPSFFGFQKAGFGPTIDPDAQAFFDRVTSAGGTLSGTEQTAVNQLVLDLKANSLWTPMKAIYPMVGASAAACAQNLKSSSFTGTFTSTGWTFASTGVTPNGTSAYFDSNLQSSANLSETSTTLSIYSRTGNTQPTHDIGSRNFGYTNPFGILSNFNNTTYNVWADFASQTSGVSSQAYFIQTKNGTTAKLFRNTTTVLTATKTLSAMPTTNVIVGAAQDATSGVYGAFSNRQYAFASIGDGLTDTQASNLYTAVQAFQTTLSRNV
jgi:hypothetical protein